LSSVPIPFFVIFDPRKAFFAAEPLAEMAPSEIKSLEEVTPERDLPVVFPGRPPTPPKRHPLPASEFEVFSH